MRWFYELLSLSLSVTPIIILLLCLNPILKKRYYAKWRYILWIAVSICLLLPISYAKNFLLSLKITETVPSELLSSTSVAVSQLPKINPINLHNANDSFGEVLIVIYFIGVIIYLAYVIFSYIGFRRDISRWSKKTINYETQTILKDEQNKLNIKRNLPLLICKKVSSPMLVGLMRPILVLPSEAYTPEELRMILTHELIHLKRNDILIKTILTAASVVHWFNPAVNLMVKQANKDMEQSCDDYVLNGCDVKEKKFYCNIILNMAVFNNNAAGHVFSTNIVSSRKNLECRIKGIFDSSKKKSGITTLIAVILFVIIFGTIFNVSGEEQLEEKSSGNEYLGEQADKINENEIGNKDEVKSKLEYREFENQAPLNNENNQPQNLEDTDPTILSAMDDIQQAENNTANHIGIQEEAIVENDMSEIVIVDLNLLENQLKESGGR